MPKEGYVSITVREDLYAKLDKLAKETFRTVPAVIEYLLEQHNSKGA